MVAPMRFSLWLESSFTDLYTSTVNGFPETTRRQHATDTIKIEQLDWTPFLGVRTLFLRGLANNHGGGGGEYRPIILFRNVEYHDAPGEGLVEFTASNGNTYHIEPLSRNHDILCRCGCMDFHYRFNWFDHLDHSLYGRVRAPYVRRTDWMPPANPQEVPGMCKHVLKLFYALEDAGLVL